MFSPIGAFKNSISGLKFAWKEDQSWKNTLFQFIFGTAVAVIIFCVYDSSALNLLLMVGSLFPMLIVETINCSIEAVTDKASPERSILAKKAKDLGSAAVMLSRLMAILFWAFALFHV